MVLWLNTTDSDFESAFSAFLGTKREISVDVDARVKEIIDDVRARGDDALYDYTLEYDRLDLKTSGMAISQARLKQAFETISDELRNALELAKNRIEAYHLRQKPQDNRYTDPIGVELGYRWSAVDAAGLYVPGGTASYPSSVLMNAVPAKVAGVKRLVMVVPTPDGVINELVLAAAHLAGVDEVYTIGGAQAVAALAYGTKTIAPVDKIVGPGNAFVAAAKRVVFGQVGIDMIAGPSEVLIIADETANADWVAIDLLAQAEHDKNAQSVLITTDKALAKAVENSVEIQLKTLPREEIARASWDKYGAIIIARDLDEACDLANRFAAEHLEIATQNPDAFVDKIRHAGSIFLGHHTPEAIGDYVAGSNHVLPTARSARFSSGLGVFDFIKRTSILRCNSDHLRVIGGAAVSLAKAEGLDAHAQSVTLRLNGFDAGDA